MAGESGHETDPVGWLRELAEAPERFDLFQALRRLECHYRGRSRLGEGRRAADEAVRLQQTPSLACAPVTVASFAPGGEERPDRLATYFFGLLGPNGPLPLHLTEHARQRELHAGDTTFSRFLDVFHQRLLALFYRAYANTEPTVALDRPQTDRFATYVGALCGLGTDAMRDRDALSHRAKLFFAGRLAPGPRNAEGLQQMVADLFGVRAEIEELVGEWIDVPKPARRRLGASLKASRLGSGSLLGSRVWHCQGKFRLVLGPLDREQLERMLPGGEDLQTLAAVVRNYVGDTLTWDLRLVLAEAWRTPMRLGRYSRLGWACWMGRGREGQRRQDVIVDPSRHHVPWVEQAGQGMPSSMRGARG